MPKKFAFLIVTTLLVGSAKAQTPAPNLSQVLMTSATCSASSGCPMGTVPSIFTYNTGSPITAKAAGSALNMAGNYSISNNLVQLNNALNSGIATALSIIPLSSPASGVILRTDSATGAELPESGTLGPILSERAETIGRHKIFVGISHQDFNFTKYNGTSLNSLQVLYTGGDPSKIVTGAGSSVSTVPATFNIAMDVRLSQNIAFLTYGVTDRFDVSLGLPVIHAGVVADTYNGMIYSGSGFAANSPNSTCWCVNTFTPGTPTLELPQVGVSNLSKTGFGDLLVRAKGSVIRKRSVVVAVGADLRLPTGDAKNYLGTGTTSFKPFAAVSFYTKPLGKGIVLSPHFDVGWQFSGQSILGGNLLPTTSTQNTPEGQANFVSTPFTATKNYLPDVFSWTGGAELALGHRTTLVADILGNQIGWIHGVPNTTMQSISGVSLPTGQYGDPNYSGLATTGTATGLVNAGRVSYGQYSGSFGYKARVVGKLVASVNFMVRFDNNGLTARFFPLYGLGYTF